MRFKFFQVGSLLALVAFVMLLSGCGQGDNKSSQVKEKDAKGKPEEKKAHDHGGWWCDEHGVPEAECSMCSAKAAAEFKKKGDWCNEHDRAKSQCSLCDPKLKEKYAAQYRAKEGKEPPPTEDEGPKKEEKK